MGNETFYWDGLTDFHKGKKQLNKKLCSPHIQSFRVPLNSLFVEKDITITTSFHPYLGSVHNLWEGNFKI